MLYLKNFQIFESLNDVTFSDENGLLVINYRGKKYHYKITVNIDYAPDFDVVLTKLIPKESGFMIDIKKGEFISKVKKSVEIHKPRVDDISKKFLEGIINNSKAPEIINCPAIQKGQQSFELHLQNN